MQYSPGIDSAGGHDSHELGDGEGLGLHQARGLRDANAKLFRKLDRIHLTQQICNQDNTLVE